MGRRGLRVAPGEKSDRYFEVPGLALLISTANSKSLVRLHIDASLVSICNPRELSGPLVRSRPRSVTWYRGLCRTGCDLFFPLFYARMSIGPGSLADPWPHNQHLDTPWGSWTAQDVSRSHLVGSYTPRDEARAPDITPDRRRR